MSLAQPMESHGPMVRFDRELIRKYDRPGPRYTSYPPAPHFRDDFGPGDYARLLAASARRPRPLSLYVHVPFCRARCFFCGCNVVIARDPGRGRRYLDMLEGEVARTAGLLAAGSRPVVQVHWGGGTPTFLPPEDLRRLMAILRRHFELAPGCEIGVEVDPRECTPEHLDALAEAGVNRLSMGLQDLDPMVQRAVNRVQSAAQTWAVLDGARARGMESVNLDLIYGLPHQSPARFAATLKEVLRMAPDRLAVFNFAYLPSLLPHQRVLDPATLPDPETKLALLELAVAELTAGGYLFIGMDHFARPRDPLVAALADGTLTRNFQGYSTCGETDLVAFGVSSISQVAGGYAQNCKALPDYRRAMANGGLATCRGLLLSPEDHLRQEVIQRLMCRFRLDKEAVGARHGIDFDRHFAAELEALQPFAADGLIRLGEGALEVTPAGRFLVRNLAMAFDAYLGERSAVRYSRTV